MKMNMQPISFVHQQVFLEATLLKDPRLKGREVKGKARVKQSSSERIQIREGKATKEGKGGRPKT